MSSKIKTGLVAYLLDSEADYLARERESAILIKDQIEDGKWKNEDFDATSDYYKGMMDAYNEAMGRLYMLRDMIKD